MEFNLDSITNIIFVDAKGGAALKRKRMPRQLTEKTAFIRQGIAEMPNLQPFTEGLALMDQIDRDAKIRNAVVHGYVGGWDERTFELHFIKLVAGKTDHSEDRQILRYEDLMDAGGRALELGSGTNDLANKLLKAFMIYDQRNKPF